MPGLPLRFFSSGALLGRKTVGHIESRQLRQPLHDILADVLDNRLEAPFLQPASGFRHEPHDVGGVEGEGETVQPTNLVSSHALTPDGRHIIDGKLETDAASLLPILRFRQASPHAWDDPFAKLPVEPGMRVSDDVPPPIRRVLDVITMGLEPVDDPVL